MQGRLGAGLAAIGGAVARALSGGAMRARTIHTLQCFDGETGALKWEESIENLTTNSGLAYMLANFWKGSNYSASFFVGLKGSGTIAAGDTMASHAGWSEITAVQQTARQPIVFGSVTGTTTASVDNSASVASYTMSGSATVAGAFVTTDSTLGGTAGTLIGASDFATTRPLVQNDVLKVTTTMTQQSA